MLIIYHTLQTVAPFWLREPNDVEVVKGSSVLLACEAGGYPPPQIRWKKQDMAATSASDSGASSGGQFRTVISSPHMQVLENGSLWIAAVSPSDQALFLCQASNNVSPSLSKQIRLLVGRKCSFSINCRLFTFCFFLLLVDRRSLYSPNSSWRPVSVCSAS